MQSIKNLTGDHFLPFIVVGIVSLAMIITSCDHPIDPSPQPGVVKITLQHNPEDTVIEMGGQTNKLSIGDFFPVTVSEGIVTRSSDSATANLYLDLESFTQEDTTYNVLRLADDGSPLAQQLFETQLPPGEYTELSFAVNTSFISFLLEEENQRLQQPVELSEPGLRVSIDTDFTIREQQTTTVRLRISSFESLTRFRDTFRFVPQISVFRIQEP